jgi:hypothetical protein
VPACWLSGVPLWWPAGLLASLFCCVRPVRLLVPLVCWFRWSVGPLVPLVWWGRVDVLGRWVWWVWWSGWCGGSLFLRCCVRIQRIRWIRWICCGVVWFGWSAGFCWLVGRVAVVWLVARLVCWFGWFGWGPLVLPGRTVWLVDCWAAVLFCWACCWAGRLGRFARPVGLVGPLVPQGRLGLHLLGRWSCRVCKPCWELQDP